MRIYYNLLCNLQTKKKTYKNIKHSVDDDVNSDRISQDGFRDLLILPSQFNADLPATSAPPGMMYEYVRRARVFKRSCAVVR